MRRWAQRMEDCGLAVHIKSITQIQATYLECVIDCLCNRFFVLYNTRFRNDQVLNNFKPKTSSLFVQSDLEGYQLSRSYKLHLWVYITTVLKCSRLLCHSSRDCLVMGFVISARIAPSSITTHNRKSSKNFDAKVNASSLL